MSFLNNLKKVFHLGGGEAKKKRLYNNIRMDCDPAEFWDMVGELGDGAFGKVYKAQHRETHNFAAAKMCTLEDEENLSDHMVEIDILSEIRHPNIVELYEAFSLDDKLWVSCKFDCKFYYTRSIAESTFSFPHSSNTETSSHIYSQLTLIHSSSRVVNVNISA